MFKALAAMAKVFNIVDQGGKHLEFLEWNVGGGGRPKIPGRRRAMKGRGLAMRKYHGPR